MGPSNPLSWIGGWQAGLIWEIWRSVTDEAVFLESVCYAGEVILRQFGDWRRRNMVERGTEKHQLLLIHCL